MTAAPACYRCSGTGYLKVPTTALDVPARGKFMLIPCQTCKRSAYVKWLGDEGKLNWTVIAFTE